MLYCEVVPGYTGRRMGALAPDPFCVVRTTCRGPGEPCLDGGFFQKLENEPPDTNGPRERCAKMTEVSKKWNSTDALAGLKGEIAAMAQGSFRLVGAAALLYISNVYWEVPRIQAKETTETIHGMLGVLNYGKSSKYALASAAMTLARNMTKKYGQPDAATDRNVIYGMLQDCETFSDAVDFMVAAIKTDYNVLTMAELYAALSGNKLSKAKDEPSLEQAVIKVIEKAETTPAELGVLGGKIATLVPGSAHIAAAALVDALNVDELNALAVMVMNRIAALTPATEDRQAA